MNKKKLDATQVEVKHGDILGIGNLVDLLVHIHSGSVSCSNCEPGEVMLRLKKEKESCWQTIC